jgi:hypothetical protein
MKLIFVGIVISYRDPAVGACLIGVDRESLLAATDNPGAVVARPGVVA